LRGLLGNDGLLLRVCLRELSAMLLDGRLERRHLLHDARVLLGGRIDGLEPVQQILEAGGPEQQRQGGVVLRGRVGGDEPGRERCLSELEVRLRDPQLLTVLALVGLDLRQADIRKVVLLDRGAHALVDLLDLRKHLLRLCLLRRDGTRRSICRCCRAQRRYAD